MYLFKITSVRVLCGYLILCLLTLAVADETTAMQVFFTLTILLAAYGVSRFMGYRKTTYVALKFFLFSTPPIVLTAYYNRLDNIGSWIIIATTIAVVGLYYWDSFKAALNGEVFCAEEECDVV